LKVLLAAGANPDEKPPGGAMPLHYAASKSINKIVSLLLQYGANPEGKPHGCPATMWEAAAQPDLPILKLLLIYGADPNETVIGVKTAF
jgi:ankyrin repeat protein